MRVALLLCGLLALGAAEVSRITDQAVRYVNSEVLTYGDVQKRVVERREELKRRGLVVPDETSNAKEWLRFYQDTLEDITDETLLVQKATELKVPIDRDRLAEQVLAEAKDRGLPLRLVAELRRIRERQAKADMVLGYFEERSANIGPNRLALEYEKRKADFHRPTRAQVLFLALRPTSAEERQELVKSLAGIMKAAQQANDAQVRAEAASRLDPFLAAAPAEQQRILGELATALGTQADRTDLTKEDARLVSDARQLGLRWGKVRDQKACQERAEAIRTEISGLAADRRADAFRNLARNESQGPHSADGGDLGWVEPGSFGHDIEEQTFAMPAGELSPVFWTSGTAALVFVLAREDGRQQGFDEVSALLQNTLDREHRQRIRTRVTAVLRTQASVRDVVALADIVK